MGAALPLLALVAASIGLPESPQLQARRAAARAPAGLAGAAAVSGGSLMALRPPYRERTLRLWLVYALSAMLMYFLVSWLPVILAAAGGPRRRPPAAWRCCSSAASSVRWYSSSGSWIAA